jgi:hypothetical protein
MPDIKEGDWVYARWGYDQTNASFWKVTKRTAHTVRLMAYQAIGLNVDGVHMGVVPDEDSPIIDHLPNYCEYKDVGWNRHPQDAPCIALVEYVRKVQVPDRDGRERIWVKRPYLIASKWDGAPKHDTIAAGLPGH